MLEHSGQPCWPEAGLYLLRGPSLSMDYASQLAARHCPSLLQAGGAARALPSVSSYVPAVSPRVPGGMAELGLGQGAWLRGAGPITDWSLSPASTLSTRFRSCGLLIGSRCRNSCSASSETPCEKSRSHTSSWMR